MTLPDLIPRSVLFGNPDRMATAISPDGTRLGWVAPEDGVLNVWVGPLDGSSPARAVTHDRDRGVRTYAFCHDDRHLVYLQDTAGDESWRLYVLDLETGEATLATPGEGVAGPDHRAQPLAPRRPFCSRSTRATRSCTTSTRSTSRPAS